MSIIDTTALVRGAWQISLVGWADAVERGGTRCLADAGELCATVFGDDVLVAGEERLDELPRAPLRHTRHSLVAVVTGQGHGRLLWHAWAASKSDHQEKKHQRDADVELPERHCWWYDRGAVVCCGYSGIDRDGVWLRYI